MNDMSMDEYGASYPHGFDPSFEPSTYSGAPDECSVCWPHKYHAGPCKECDCGHRSESFKEPGNFVRMVSEMDKARRLRRLIKCMCRQAILSEGEAVSAIVAHRRGDGRYGGAEAVVHYGGGTRIIRDAIRHRGWWMRSIYGRWEDA